MSETSPTAQSQRGIIRGRPSTVVNSDGWLGYDGLVDLGHFRVSKDAFAKGAVHGIEGFLAKVRRSAGEVHLPEHTFHLHLKETE